MTRRIASVVSVLIMAVMLSPELAMAHGQEKFGDRVIVIGWAIEPAYAGQANAVELKVEDADGTGVEGLADSLKVTVAFGGSTSDELSLEAAFGEAGTYHAPIVPTEPGEYTFRVTGKIEGVDLDLTKKSGPDSFDEVKNSTSLQFPTKVPSPADLSARVDRVDSRAAQTSDDAASSAKLALTVGAAAAILALIALVLGLRKK